MIVPFNPYSYGLDEQIIKDNLKDSQLKKQKAKCILNRSKRKNKLKKK